MFDVEFMWRTSTSSSHWYTVSALTVTRGYRFPTLVVHLLLVQVLGVAVVHGEYLYIKNSIL